VPKLTYVSADGDAEVVDAPSGTSVMMAALSNSVDGILAECGGQAMCATCHVYVTDEWRARLPEMAEDEDMMLDEAHSERLPQSRLSCQIPVTEDLDGLVVELPPTQA